MVQKNRVRTIRRVDVQVSLFTAAMVTLSCLCVFAFHYKLTYDNMIGALVSQVESMHGYVERLLTEEIFTAINTPEDMNGNLYLDHQEAMFNVKQATGVQYFYTAKRTEDGQFVYVIDGLDPNAPDFRKPGDPIEPEIIPELERALAGETVMPNAIKDTDWGKIFIAYLPVHSQRGTAEEVMGVVGIEFEAEAQYDTYRALRVATPIITLLACLVSAFFSFYFFRRISNPTFRDMANTDYLTGLKSRNAFDTDLKNLAAQRDHAGMGVMVVDLNNLKQVNDTLGHDAGDRYLKTLAQALGETAPDKAVPYRVGGDEFVLLTRETDAPLLCQLSERLKSRFAEIRPQGWPVDLSLSVGCALFNHSQDQSLYDTYRRADGDMYMEKQSYHRNT